MIKAPKIFTAAMLTLLFAALTISTPSTVAQANKGEPLKAYGITLPDDSELLQNIAGSASFRVPDNVMAVENLFREKFKAFKNLKVTSRTVGRVHMVVFEDLGENPWATVQITGATIHTFCYIVINRDNPSEIDANK